MFFPLLFGVGLLLVVAESNVSTYRDLIDQPRRVAFIPPLPQTLQLALLLAGWLLIATGLTHGSRRQAKKGTASLRNAASAAPLWFVLLLAFALRLYALGDAQRILIDEMNTVAEVLDLRDQPDTPLLLPMTDVSPFPWLFALAQRAGADLLGSNLLGLRFASAVAGTLTVAAVYLLAVEMQNSLTQRCEARKAAERTSSRQTPALHFSRFPLLAALCLAVYPPHVHYSRLALLNIADPLFGTLALTFLLRGLRTGQTRAYALAGVMLGMTHYFYEGGRLFFTLFALLWVMWIGIVGRGRPYRPQLRKVGVMLLAVVLIALPLYAAWIGINAPLAGRFDAMGAGQLRWLRLFGTTVEGDLFVQTINKLAAAFGMFLVTPETSLFYGGGQPLMLIVIVPFFLLGVLISVRRINTPLALPLLWWLAVVLANGLLLDNSTATPRYVLAFPPIALITALGLTRVMQGRTAAGLNHVGARRAVVLRFGVLLVLCLAQVGYYFAAHIPTHNQQLRAAPQHADVDDALLRAAELPPQTQIIVITTRWRLEPSYVPRLMRYLTDAPPGLSRAQALLQIEITPAYLALLPKDVPYAFFIEPEDTTTPALLARYFALQTPDGLASPYADLPRNRQFRLYLTRPRPR